MPSASAAPRPARARAQTSSDLEGGKLGCLACRGMKSNAVINCCCTQCGRIQMELRPHLFLSDCLGEAPANRPVHLDAQMTAW